ncbi:replication-associated recombination protein A [Mycoplasma leonicaptivi]|uniref:replication-associated recombination protein A n=1 Tax=Mycoplasma leonicaptivi TaxID=36742 RepID=UPI000486691D|nr:replication-associated recombination protein A [Mycoplasma leonicaptivi]
MNNNLANQIRPEKIDDIIGQNKIKILLKEVIKNNLNTSFIFFGESGIGKTSTAFALAKERNLTYGYFNASIDNKTDLLKILNSCKIIIVDEIHRLNKDKQEILLSFLEFDKIIVYATTTENPYFKVVPAIRSRMHILEFNKLDISDIVHGLRKVVSLHYTNLNISDEKLKLLAQYSSGDYRSCLNNLQMLSFLKDNNDEITEKEIKTLIPNINFFSDKDSSQHYNNLSAFHKSLRGSDVDASLYYGFLILKSGDIDGLFRRMLCVAYEDVGLANPNIALRVDTAIRAFERLGLPEGELCISTAICDLALSPKSNSTYLAKEKIKNEYIDVGKIYQIPKHLRDSHYASSKYLGDGVDYKYPHNYEFNFVKQQYLPKEINNVKFYIPQKNKNENDLEKYWTIIKNKKENND